MADQDEIKVPRMLDITDMTEEELYYWHVGMCRKHSSMCSYKLAFTHRKKSTRRSETYSIGENTLMTLGSPSKTSLDKSFGQEKTSLARQSTKSSLDSWLF
jgi:hypothetical protein